MWQACHGPGAMASLLRLLYGLRRVLLWGETQGVCTEEVSQAHRHCPRVSGGQPGQLPLWQWLGGWGYVTLGCGLSIGSPGHSGSRPGPRPCCLWSAGVGSLKFGCNDLVWVETLKSWSPGDRALGSSQCRVESSLVSAACALRAPGRPSPGARAGRPR